MATDQETVLDVSGMTCGSCSRHVSAALREVEGVRAVEVLLREGKVRVQHDLAEAPVTALVESLRHAGYPSKTAE